MVVCGVMCILLAYTPAMSSARIRRKRNHCTRVLHMSSDRIGIRTSVRTYVPVANVACALFCPTESQYQKANYILCKPFLSSARIGYLVPQNHNIKKQITYCATPS